MQIRSSLFLSFALNLVIGGSAYAQLAPPSASPKSAITPAAASTVTTTGGTSGTVPLFTGKSTIANSIIFQNSTTGIGVGIVPASTTALDVNGKAVVRGVFNLSRTGNATTSTGYNSYPFIFNTSAYSTSTSGDVSPVFALEAEVAGNKTANPSATFNLLYGHNAGTPGETGLYFNSNGTIHFASGQTFPGGATGITSVAHDSSLAGSGTSASPLGIASVAHDANLTGSGTSASPLGLSYNVNIPGTVSTSGISASGTISAVTGSVNGVYASSSYVNGNGVYGSAPGSDGFGVYADGGYFGIYAHGLNKAGDFAGDVYVSGTLSKAGGSFKIDHPLDPENKYLSHSFVESPDMMNVYNGNVVTDESGTAVVTLPDWFESLNRDFRYQLTPIGQFAQAMVASEIADGKFTIRTDKGNVKVSWQVTGIRQDAWANAHRIPVEEEKAEGEKGHFLHPELFKRGAGELAIGERPRF